MGLQAMIISVQQNPGSASRLERSTLLRLSRLMDIEEKKRKRRHVRLEQMLSRRRLRARSPNFSVSLAEEQASEPPQ